MAKDVKGYIKLQINGGQANPAPPVGPALGQYGVPIQDFTSQFNERTKDKMGVKLPALVKGKLNLKKGSGVPQKDKVGHLTMDMLKELAEEKMPDLNAYDMAGAMKTIMGTARATGVTTDIDDMTLTELRAKLAA